MKQLTIRGLGDEDGPRANTVGSSLDHLIGTWSDAEADEFDQALRDFETIDGAGGPGHPRECAHRLNERNHIGQLKE